MSYDPLVRNLSATPQRIDRQVHSRDGDPWEPLWTEPGGLFTTIHTDQEDTEVRLNIRGCYVNMGFDAWVTFQKQKRRIMGIRKERQSKKPAEI